VRHQREGYGFERALSLPCARLEDAQTLAVLVAAGRSSRMRAAQRKPFLELDGTLVLVRAARALAAAPSVRALVVVVHQDDVQHASELLDGPLRPRGLAAVVAGGDERIDSVRAGARHADAGVGTILVHDGARPLVTPEEVEAVIRAAREHGAALLALAMSETVKRSRDGRFAEESLPREELWRAQSPQAFEAARFRELLARAEREGFRPTDDAALWERWVGPVALVPGSPANLKISRPEDLEIARAIARSREKGP